MDDPSSSRTTHIDAEGRLALASSLEDVVSFFRRFISLQDPRHVDVLALWTAHTHAIAAADATPYLVITSPEKQSGKTRVQECIELVVRDPWRVTAPSEAVLYRYIHSKRPTLLLDEVDAVFKARANDPVAEGLRALLDAGNRRGVTVPRCLNGGTDIAQFQVFGAKCLAGIGRVPETLADRSIPIPMVRKLKTEQVERFRRRDVEPEAVALREALSAAIKTVWDRIDGYRAADYPDALSDRQLDGWEPLFAIADAAGNRWPDAARDVAVAIHAQAEDDSDDLLLLRHIREAFDDPERAKKEGRISTGRLLTVLQSRDDGPWARWWPPFNSALAAASDLSRHLRKYGIASKKFRIGSQTIRGYDRLDFDATWDRYL